ncbi:MAG: hypothetical protein AABW73_00375 [Nanoarchaeota archaeon]
MTNTKKESKDRRFLRQPREYGPNDFFEGERVVIYLFPEHGLEADLIRGTVTSTDSYKRWYNQTFPALRVIIEGSALTSSVRSRVPRENFWLKTSLPYETPIAYYRIARKNPYVQDQAK